MSLPYLPYKLSGNLSSPYLLIFMHGYPDTFELWDPLIAPFALDFLCANISYPNFATLKQESKWGYDFPEITEALKRTLDKIDLTPNESNTVILKEKLLIAHDWGCFYGYIFDKKYPGYIKGMVALDVAPYFTPGIYEAAYQLTLAVGFLVGGTIGQFLTRKVLKLFEYQSPWSKYVNASMNYPYYYLYRNIFRSILGKDKPFLTGYVPSFPVTYIYAKDKKTQFQNQKWFDWLNKNKGICVAVNGGHWIMNKHKELIIEKVKERIGILKAKL